MQLGTGSLAFSTANAVALEPDGKIVLAGNVLDANDDAEFMVARLIGDLPPVATFTAARLGLTASFTGTTPGADYDAVTSYAWSFGDGASGAGIHVSHTYARSGTYTVAVTVTDADGLTSTSSQRLTVPSPFAGSTLVSTRLKLGKHDSLSLALRCPAGVPGGKCLDAIVVESTARRAKRLGSASFTVAAGRTLSVSLKLRHRPGSHALLRLSSRDSLGQSKTISYRVAIRRT